MKPDKPGEWHSRDGRKIVVFPSSRHGGLDYVETKYGNSGCVESLAYLNPFNLSDWLPAVAPMFPELPPKPPQVLLRAHGQVRWYAVEGDRIRWMQGFDYLRQLPDDLRIIDHPDNDKEAVRLIKEAKRG